MLSGELISSNVMIFAIQIFTPHNPYSASHEVEMLAKAIKKCGRSVVLSLSPGPALIEKAWHYENNANMWRITDDFWDDWSF